MTAIANVTARMRAWGKSKTLLDMFAAEVDRAAAEDIAKVRAVASRAIASVGSFDPGLREHLDRLLERALEPPPTDAGRTP